MQAGQVHYSAPLTNLAVEFTPPELQWSAIFGKKHVQKEQDFWTVFDKNLFEHPDDSRADGAPSRETTGGWKYVPYVCQEHALHDIITKRMRDNADSELDLEASMAKIVKQQVWNNIEVACFGTAGLLRVAANNAHVNNSVNWANITTASPRGDITDAINQVELNSGITPNTIVIGTDVARHIMRTAEYREEFKFVQDIRGEATVDLPNNLYGLNAVYVKSLVTTQRKGQAKTLARVMGDDVWIGYVNPSGPGYRTLTYGACLYTEEYAAKWYDNDRRGDKIEYGMIYDLVIIARECGGLLTSVLS